MPKPGPKKRVVVLPFLQMWKNNMLSWLVYWIFVLRSTRVPMYCCCQKEKPAEFLRYSTTHWIPCAYFRALNTEVSNSPSTAETLVQPNDVVWHCISTENGKERLFDSLLMCSALLFSMQIPNLRTTKFRSYCNGGFIFKLRNKKKIDRRSTTNWTVSAESSSLLIREFFPLACCVGGVLCLAGEITVNFQLGAWNDSDRRGKLKRIFYNSNYISSAKQYLYIQNSQKCTDWIQLFTARPRSATGCSKIAMKHAKKK